jgi:hypothetical protein
VEETGAGEGAADCAAAGSFFENSLIFLSIDTDVSQ